MYKTGNIGKTEYRFFRRYRKMHFIGIFASNVVFQDIRRHVMRMLKRNDLEFININASNIENMRNITFETIVLSNQINMSTPQKDFVNQICNHCKYVIINSDICTGTQIIPDKMVNCITYGLNQKSTITISSIQNDKAIIYLQRNIKNIEENEIEMGEVSINLKEYEQVSIEDLLAIFSIYFIYKQEND